MRPYAAEIMEMFEEIDPNEPDVTAKAILHRFFTKILQKTTKQSCWSSCLEGRVQGENEPFAKFRCTLKELAEIAEVCNECRKRQIVSKMIVGIRDDEARRIFKASRVTYLRSFKSMSSFQNRR